MNRLRTSASENTKGEKLTSRALKDECVFDAGYVVESIKQTIDGKEKRFQNKTPISFILKASPSPSEGGGSGSGSGSGSSSTPTNNGDEPGEGD